MNTPLSEPDITEIEIEAVIAALRSSRLSLGPMTERFEHLVADYIGVAHGVAVNSGTSGLHLCVRALGIGPGDEVIVPSFTFIAAANAIRYEGATPVFADVEPHTLNLDPICVEAAITSRTRALMIVHTFGCPANLDALLDIAHRYHLRVIEDACEAIGATFRDRRIGSFGDAAVFAFYPNKQITTGEGGLIVTRDAHLAREMRAMRNQGRYESDAWHQHSILGFNYRLSEMNCALGIAQLSRIGEILAKRARAAVTYHELLQDCTGLTLPPMSVAHGSVSWFVYVVRLATGEPGIRDHVARSLAGEGIQTGRYFAPVHQQLAYSGWPITNPLRVTERESLRTLALPFFTTLTQRQITTVCRALRRILSS